MKMMQKVLILFLVIHFLMQAMVKIVKMIVKVTVWV